VLVRRRAFVECDLHAPHAKPIMRGLIRRNEWCFCRNSVFADRLKRQALFSHPRLGVYLPARLKDRPGHGGGGEALPRHALHHGPACDARTIG
jgi:hypothetical protein